MSDVNGRGQPSSPAGAACSSRSTTASKKRHGASGPNRSLPRGGQANVSYQSLSTAGGLVVSRSALESDVLALLEMDPLVLSFERNDLRPQERVRYTIGRLPPENEVFDLADGRRRRTSGFTRGGGADYMEVGPYEAKTTEPHRSHLEEAMTLAGRAGDGDRMPDRGSGHSLSP